MSGDWTGPLARLRQIGRFRVTPDVLGQLRTPTRAAAAPSSTEARDLQARVAHLEQLVQGLQDSVYREARRHDTRLTELEARTEPTALAAALSQDARERGL